MSNNYDTPESRWGRLERKLDALARDVNQHSGRIDYIEKSIGTMHTDSKDYATKESIAPLKLVVYGIVGVTCTAVLMTLLGFLHLNGMALK